LRKVLRSDTNGGQGAGQGIERRRVLQIMGTAAAAAQFPGFSKWAFACGHASKLTEEIKPAAYRPQFFTGPEYAAVERLVEIIIPSDRTPGAKEAGVAEFIVEAAGLNMDDMVSMQIFCTDLKLYDIFNAAFKTYFHGDFPARSFIGTDKLLRNGRYEVMGIAIKRAP
jgi:hypothetical protein